MRPTIPLARWRVAVDLTAVPRLVAYLPDPPCGRRCPMCRNWAVAVHEVFPRALEAQLQRLGIDARYPSDLYGIGTAPGQYGYRVTYHTVGRILSGPITYVADSTFGPVRQYEIVREQPGLGLSVAYDQDVHGGVDWQPEGNSSVVQVDFRLTVPWLLSEAGPADFIAPSDENWRTRPWARARRRANLLHRAGG